MEMNLHPAIKKAVTCPHCSGRGKVNDWKHGGMKSCFKCAGTGGKPVTKYAYNIHR